MSWLHRFTNAPQTGVVPDRVTLLNMWDASAACLTVGTRRCYHRHIIATVPASGCASLDIDAVLDISAQTIAATQSASWKRQRFAALRSFLCWAINAGYAPHLFAQDVTYLADNSKTPRASPIVTAEALRHLFGRGTTLRDQLLVTMTLDLGWSPERLVALNQGDMMDGSVHGLLLSRQTTIYVERLIGPSAHQPQTPLFRSREGHEQRLSARQARHILAMIAHKSGVPIALSRAVHQRRLKGGIAVTQ